jgi:hypothetical protein
MNKNFLGDMLLNLIYVKLRNIHGAWINIVLMVPGKLFFIHSFISGSTALLLGPGLLFSFIIFFTQMVGLLDRLCGLVVRVSGYRNLPDFLTSRGSGTGCTQPRDHN